MQGTLDLLLLKALSLEPMHGWGITTRIQQLSRDSFQIGARVAVSRPPSIRAARLGDVLLADHPEQSHREVLRSHGGGQAGAR